jgi:hypothetical protein
MLAIGRGKMPDFCVLKNSGTRLLTRLFVSEITNSLSNEAPTARDHGKQKLQVWHGRNLFASGCNLNPPTTAGQVNKPAPATGSA